ncbi:hypothetical protein CPB83DRAFT_841670 [Crepidotus variabilis]|uniref:Uncharacterized protein n=1 Tax=Crepidotus variabilis TaxID=179855 RepID=A0A9P6EUP6_9AGAR|nr:hypothetical protein CPB83DRAFT_841670 [Crepidotus variabilis]
MMTRRGSSNHSYELLPTTDQSNSRSRRPRSSGAYGCCRGTSFQRTLTRHRQTIRFSLYYAIRIILGGVTLLFLYVLWYGGIPPSYAKIRAQERALPQHHWNQKKSGKYVSEGPKYVRFPNHYWGRGLNNVLEEAMLSCHLVQAINRTYVFEDHVWSHLPLPYTFWQWTLRPVRVPMSSFLGGVLVGQDEEKIKLPLEQRSISQEYFDYTCSSSDVVEVQYGMEEDEPPSVNDVVLPYPRRDAPGDEIVDWWARRMALPDVKDARCVVINEKRRRVWNWTFYSHSSILDYFPVFRQSHVFQGFDWSPVVWGAAKRSLTASFFSSTTQDARREELPSFSSNLTQRASIDEHFPRTLAIHLRMGDYDGHCLFLNKWNVEYLSFPFPESQGGGVRNSDTFDPSPFLKAIDDPQAAEAQRKAKLAYYMEHCLPSITQVVKRLRNVRADYEADRDVGHGPRDSLSPKEQRAASRYRLNKVYILTNGKPAVMQELKQALLADDWEMVSATPDLEVGWSKLENAVSGAIDMAIAERAEVFVGNGFSSMSANVIMLRMAKGYRPYSHRLL